LPTSCHFQREPPCGLCDQVDRWKETEPRRGLLHTSLSLSDGGADHRRSLSLNALLHSHFSVCRLSDRFTNLLSFRRLPRTPNFPDQLRLFLCRVSMVSDLARERDEQTQAANPVSANLLYLRSRPEVHFWHRFTVNQLNGRCSLPGLGRRFS
jgi:hypothetical protein